MNNRADTMTNETTREQEVSRWFTTEGLKGPFVHADDYDALASERDDLRAKLAEATRPSNDAQREAVAWRWHGNGLSEGWWNGSPNETDMALAKKKGWTIERAYTTPPADDTRDAAMVAALEQAIQHLAHKASCASIRPTSEWPEHGSVSYANCDCVIKVCRAAIAAQAAGKGETNGDVTP